MASSKFTLNNTYQEIATGSATIQKVTAGFGTVLIAFGTSAPANDNGSFVISDTLPRYFATEDSIYAKTPSGVSIDLVVGA